MGNLESFNANNEDIRNQTLEAIEAGTAMPLPEFLQNDPEARRAFAEAIKNSKTLRDSMSELSQEERDAFLKAFAEVLSSDGEIGSKEEIEDKLMVKRNSLLSLGIAAGGIATGGMALAGTGLLIAAVGAIINYKAVISLLRGDDEKSREIKDYILETVRG